MTSPEAEPRQEQAAPPPEPEESGLTAWARAIWYGLGDTAQDILAEARRGAREAQDQGWQRFDKKTRFRRSAEKGRGTRK
jgi:hypothetical protein